MIKPLRKRHLLIWIALAILLPIGIVVAWISIPKKVTQQLLQPPASGLSSLKSIDTSKSK